MRINLPKLDERTLKQISDTVKNADGRLKQGVATGSIINPEYRSITLARFGGKTPDCEHFSRDGHEIYVLFSRVKSFKVDKGNPLSGRVVVLNNDMTDYATDISFRSTDEYPKVGQEITFVAEKIPLKEVIRRDAVDLFEVKDYKALYKSARRGGEAMFHPACIVNGVPYVAKRFESLAHPEVLRMFKNAVRV